MLYSLGANVILLLIVALLFEKNKRQKEVIEEMEGQLEAYAGNVERLQTLLAKKKKIEQEKEAKNEKVNKAESASDIADVLNDQLSDNK